MSTTTAAVLRAPDGAYALESLELEEPGLGEVRVALVASGMCHTDVAVRDPFRPTPYPVVLGHEGSGRIEAVGPGVTDLEIGQPVVLSYASCGQCRFCRRAEPTYCESIWALNFACCRLDGSTSLSDENGPIGSHFFGQSSFSTHAVVPRSSIVPVPEEAPLELLGPLGCGIQTGAGAVLNVFQTRPGDSIVVLGGAVGRDGVGGATFSSQTMQAETADVAGSSVQIGDPIVEKGLIDVVVAARDAGQLFSAPALIHSRMRSTCAGSSALEIGIGSPQLGWVDATLSNSRLPSGLPGSTSKAPTPSSPTTSGKAPPVVTTRGAADDMASIAGSEKPS